MRENSGPTRRRFLASGSAALGAVAIGPMGRTFAPAHVLGANERINLAVVGHGMRGPQLIDQIHRLPEDAGGCGPAVRCAVLGGGRAAEGAASGADAG